VKYPDVPSAMTPAPHSGELPVPKPLENLTFNDDNSDSDEDRIEQEGSTLIAIRHLEQAVPHLNPIY